MNNLDRIPNFEPELMPDPRIRISLDYQGRKRSFFLPVWSLVLAAAVAILGLVLIGVFAFRGSGKEISSPRLKELETENKFLSGRVSSFESALDSLAALMDTLDVGTQAAELDFPYYSGRTEEARSKLKATPTLVGMLETLDRKLIRLWGRLGVVAPDSTYAAGDDEPVSGDGVPSIYPTFGFFSDSYGSRIHPITLEPEFHPGVDIANEIGTPVYATANGVVSKVEYEEGYGRFIRITHSSGFESLYAHLHTARVKPGDTITKGQIIALMGDSGFSTGPHLHYEVRRNNETRNPSSYLNRIDNPGYKHG